MKDWERQEKRVALRTGGTQNAGSGSGWKRQHDVRSHGREGFLWEMKLTGKKQITIKSVDTESVRKTALLEGRTPLLGIELASRNYVLIEEDDLMEMKDEALKWQREALKWKERANTFRQMYAQVSEEWRAQAREWLDGVADGE